jgi:WD40 repeat protein
MSTCDGSLRSVAYARLLLLVASLLLFSAQILGDPIYPPLVPDGEKIDDLDGLISGIDRSSPFKAVAFSPDGQILASGSEDGTVRLWNPATGAHLRTLKGHRSWISSVAFSPDGHLLVSASGNRGGGTTDNTVRLWDPATGENLRILVGHDNRVISAVFSPDGSQIASCSYDGTVRLWDSTTGDSLHILEADLSMDSPLAFSPDGRRLATSTGRLLTFWDSKTGQVLLSVPEETPRVAGPLAFSKDGSLLAGASTNGDALLLDPSTGAVLRTLEGNKTPVNAVAFSPDGRLLAVAYGREYMDPDLTTVRLWDPMTGENLRTLKGHRRSVNAVTFSPDGRVIASASDDMTIRLWDTATGEPLRTLESQLYAITSLAFSPDGEFVASGESDGTLSLRSVTSGEVRHIVKAHVHQVDSVAFSPDGRLLASAGFTDTAIPMWDTISGESLVRLEGHRFGVNAVAFSPDGRFVASGSTDQTVRLWEPTTGKPLRTLEGHRDSVESLAFNGDGSLLASGSADGIVNLWDPTTGKNLRTLYGHEGYVHSLAFSPDGRMLASGSRFGNSLMVRDPRTGALVSKPDYWGGQVEALSFRPDGKVLASGSYDKTVYLWDPESGEKLRTVEGDWGAVRAVSFSPDGHLLAFVTGDGTVRLSDPTSGETKTILLSGRDGLWAMCMIAEERCWRHDDGTLLARSGKNGLVEPVLPPAAMEPARLVIDPAQHPKQGQLPIIVALDGQSTRVNLRVRNLGPGLAYRVRIYQERSSGDPLLFTPPPVRSVLKPGETWITSGKVSYLARSNRPEGMDGQLRLHLEQANGDHVTIEIPVHARSPELVPLGQPEKIAGDVPTLAVRIRNAGEQELQVAEIRASISGVDKPLARVTEDSIPAGAEVALSFALPVDATLTSDSLLTLTARELSHPRHDWTFADQPIRIPAPPWQLWVGLSIFVLALLALLWYLRQYTHPMTKRLATDPTALPRLGLEELAKARLLLKRTHRLSTILAANGIHARWLDQALQFDNGIPEDQVKRLAQRIGASWQRKEGLGTDGAIKRFELALGDDFPLNLKTCSVVFPPGDWPDQDVLTSLSNRGDQVCLVLAGNPQQRASLSRRCRTPDNWLVAPKDGELSVLLLSPEPVDAFAKLIAGYVKVARISPYQTSAGVSKESAFFGRAQIISDIQHREPANYLLVGGRQLGKSSLLLALKRRYDQDEGVDCSYVSVGKATIESKIAGALGMQTSSPLEVVLDRLAEMKPGKRRLLLLDEADVFVQRDAERGHACLNGFRSLSGEGRCQFVLAGFWSLYRSASFDYHSPIKNFAETISIGALEPDACRELAIRPMEALNLHYEADDLVARILDLTGGRANLIAIICDQMLKGLGLAQRELGEADLERALESRSLRSALEGWANLTGEESSDRLDRLIVYGLIGREEFGLGEVLELLTELGLDTMPERVKESLTRLELAFIIGRSQNRFRWQVPLWREQVLAEEPQRMLKRELGAYDKSTHRKM